MLSVGRYCGLRSSRDKARAVSKAASLRHRFNILVEPESMTNHC